MIKNLINKIIILLKQKDAIMDEVVEIKQRAKPGPKPGWKTELETKVQEMQSEQNTKQTLYFVEGLVELNSGSGRVQSEQKRIVWASNVPEAMEKFTAHFFSLNTEIAIYTVFNMAVSEAIN
jgi:hypothetical protein